MTKYGKILLFYTIMLIVIAELPFISYSTQISDKFDRVDGVVSFLEDVVVIPMFIVVVFGLIIGIQIAFKLVCIILQSIAVCTKKEKVKDTLSKISIIINLCASYLCLVAYLFQCFYNCTFIYSARLFFTPLIVLFVCIIDIYLSSRFLVKLNKSKLSSKIDLYNLE